MTLTEPECGNSCWSEVCVEDKFAPEVICRDDTMSCVEFQFMTHEPMVIEHCQGYELRQVDEIVTNYDCNDEFQKLITQKWIAIDDSGNISDTCTQEIYISRFPFGDLVAPVRDTQIYCASGYEEDANGNPSPNAAGVPRLDVDNDILDTMLSVWPQPDFFCNVLVDYRDLDLGEVNCVRKIMRTWEVTEWWCQSDSTRRFQQLIEIIDTVGPDLAIGPDTIYAKAGRRSCDALVDLPVAFVNDACHEVDRVDMVYPGGFSGDQNGGQVRLPVGANAVVYRAYDECYNETTDTVIVMVRDQVAPIAVCEQNTVITLDNDGLVHVYADVFDDGSFDECALDKIEVRRMTDNCNSGTDVWGDYVEFCCADVGQVVMVGFRVTDKSGNVNTCMVNARVQDKQAPRVTDLPDITIDCRFDWDPNNLDVFGTFVFDPADRDSIIVDADTVAFDGEPLDGLVIDNCPPVMEERLDTSGLTNCGMGFIMRHFTFEDAEGNISSSSQRIDIVPFDLFTFDQIIWPRDVDTVNVCGAANLRPELLPEAQAFPRFIDEDECSLIGYDYKDELIDASNGSEACFKIIRRWTVIDWCQEVNDTTVKWFHAQYIEVQNTIAPEITSECRDTLIEVINNDCEPFPIELSATATDVCTDDDELFWRYKIDQDNDGTFETVERGNVFNGTYPFGVHRIKWLVEDLCGNQDSCEYIFEIRNSKNPTAYCKTGVVAELTPMDLDNDGTPDTEMVEIWANDFDEGSFHICGHPVVLSFDQFDTTASGQVLVLDCNDLPAGVKITNIPVTVWVTDRVTGNQSSCNTMVSLQDNNNVDVCTNLTGGVSGLVSTEWDVAIDEAEVMLHGSGMGMYMTDTEGEYDFQGVPLGGQYEIEPGKDGDDMNGVSTGDLVRIQRHLLGLNTLQSPYQLIAADVNNSEHVSAADIAELRKLILGVYDEFPNNHSWRFVDGGYQFPDPTDPWYEVFPETYELHPFEMDMEVDFVGVKIGDLNGDVDFGATSNQGRSTRRILLEEGEIEPGRMYEVTFRMEDMDEVDGYQFTMEWNTEVLELAEVVPNLGLGMGLHNFGMTRLDDGIITTSWVKTQDVDDDRLFVVRFTAKQQALMSEVINVTSKVTAKEAYTDGGMYTEDLALEFRGGIQSSYFALYQNEPNPWNSTTTISFHLPKADMVQLTIFDETGRVVKMIEEAHEEGYSEVQFNADDFNGSGVLYYRLETAGHTATRKMVLID